jgi:hypothetical protein
MMPNFIIIGAPRAGTTSLYHYLRQHPQIAMSIIKETNYFAFLASQLKTENKIKSPSNWPVRTMAEYETLFDTKKDTKAIGEASPFYFYAPGVAQQIKLHLPNAKLILILRNPVERAYSTYLKNRREGIESRSFENAIEEEIRNPSNIVSSENFYIRAGLYFEHISHYLQHFDRSQIKIVFQKDFQETPLLFLEELYKFLDVDTKFTADVSVHFNEALPPLIIKNTSMRQYMKTVTHGIRAYLPQKLYFSLLKLKYMVNKNIFKYPPLQKQTRLLLRDQYIQDIQHLQDLLRTDLSNWLAVE